MTRLSFTTLTLSIALILASPSEAEEILIDNPFEIAQEVLDEEVAVESVPETNKKQSTEQAVPSVPNIDSTLSPEEQEADRKRRERIRQQRIKNRRLIQFDRLDKAAAAVAATDSNEEKAKEKPKSFIESLAAKKNRQLDPQKHEMLHPSKLFKLFFGAWRLQVANIALLRDPIEDLIRLHPDCRIVIGEVGSKAADIVACSDPRSFGAEGDEVIFEFLASNDVLIGAEFFFNEERRAKSYARLIENEIAEHNSTFKSAIGDAIDSPLFMVSVQNAQRGFMVKITAHLKEAIDAFETYGRENIRSISFGEVDVGKTRLTDLKIDSEECSRMNADNEIAEFYGQCFGFPYEAHYQLNLNPATNVVEMIAMTPIGVLTANLVETALTRKYGEPQYCDQIASDVRLVRTNRAKTYHRASKPERIRKQKSTVFSGQCEQPIVFTAAERYIFVNNVLTPQRIEKDYLQRKADNELLKENKIELDRRKGRLEGFF